MNKCLFVFFWKVSNSLNVGKDMYALEFFLLLQFLGLLRIGEKEGRKGGEGGLVVA